MIFNLIRRPALWLLIQPILLLAALTATANMTPRAEPDTAGYREFDFSSWRAALSQRRTLGYPVFLRAVGHVSPSLATAPYLQLALHAAAVAVLYGGLRRYGFAWVPALAASSTLLYSGFFLTYVSVLLPDAAALSLAVMALASLAAAVGRGGFLAWSGVVIFTALAYHFRPAYLFLVPLAPVLGTAMWWLAGAASDPSLRVHSDNRRFGWMRLTAGTALATAAPLLIFCGLRWAAVGHFGLVSFGGYNIIGITGQILTPQIAEELPAHLQPVARAILHKAAETPNWKPPAGYYDMYDNYADAVWKVTAPAAMELYGNDDVLVNERLTELSREIIRRRPMAYVRWLLPAARHGVAQLFEYSFLDLPGLVMLATLLVCEAALIARRRRQSEVPANRPDCFLELRASLLIALGFAAAKLALVILVEPPIHRYVAAAAIFLPMWLAVLLIRRLSSLARNLH